MFHRRSFVLALVVAGTALPALAQDKAMMASVKARQGQMQMIAANMGILGGMAKGAVAYDATMAARAAADLAAIGTLNQKPLWLEGSDSMAMDGTRAEPKIWDDWAEFDLDWQDFAITAATATETAGNGQDALGPILSQLGGTCKACHDDFRTPN